MCSLSQIITKRNKESHALRQKEYFSFLVHEFTHNENVNAPTQAALGPYSIYCCGL